MKILTDNWAGSSNSSQSFEPKSFDEIENCILKLNQKEFTQVLMDSSNGYLLIGGGGDEYIVSLTIGDDDEFFDLINIREQDNKDYKDIVTGGQLGSFSSNIVVDIELALKAAKYYYEHEKMDPSLTWKES